MGTEINDEEWPVDDSLSSTWDVKSIPTIDLSSFDSMLSSSTLNSYTYSTTSTTYGNVTIGAVGSSSPYYTINTGAGANGTWGTIGTAKSGLHVSSDAEFEGDIKWKGRSLGKLLEKIEDRLAVLTEPDPKKLEKFAAVKKAYDNYKLMEKLIGDDWEDKDGS